MADAMHDEHELVSRSKIMSVDYADGCNIDIVIEYTGV